MEQQFHQLYHDKYQPLKESHKAVAASNQQLQEQQLQLQEQLEKLRTQLATADLKLRKSGLEGQALNQQLQQHESNAEGSASGLFAACTHLNAIFGVRISITAAG